MDGKAKGIPWQPRLWVTGGLILGSVLGLVWRGLPSSEASRQALAQESSTALPVSTQEVQPIQAYEAQQAYTGEIRAKRSSELGFERGGEVVQILVSEGMTVTAGSPLAYLDTRTLEAERQGILAQLATAQAQLQELQADPRVETIAAAAAAVEDVRQQLALAELSRQRRQDLFNEGAISRQQLDEVAYQVGSLQARLTAAQQQLQELQTGTRPEQIAAQQARVQQLQASLVSLDVALSKSVIRAPFAGRVGLRYVNEGTVVGSGQPVLRLVESGSWEARIGVPPQLLPPVGSRQTLEVGSQSYGAEVVAILPEVDPASRTVTVLLAVQADGTTHPDGADPDGRFLVADNSLGAGGTGLVDGVYGWPD
ncbi:HlyD family efflux transporter periplasmic adaptor subunit [Synechococcus sp. Nb3U1]|uniref:HlyD family secretion protein n=1 Tax=Synechococcus sp. Nb3U1 TaxID=1914529 RepID=UPI001F188819|nr:HlyD family efflux transporter periplasmic adaptor subunit [Synechococcus sp. Nb3U1]MCF2971374.1 HlyD family efflux transporter periplasmic adaptor subunit [Synechococcus sp. Nb3U1]